MLGLGQDQVKTDNKSVDIANSVIKSVQKGMKAILERQAVTEKRRQKKKKSSGLNIEGIYSSEDSKPTFQSSSMEWVTKFENSGSDAETSLRRLAKIEKDFMAGRKMIRNHDAWNYWYYAASFSYTRWHFGKCQMHRRAKAVRVINRTFSQLWSSDGPAAVMLLCALAGMPHNMSTKRESLTGTERRNTLSKASRISDAGQDEVIRLIVKGLTGALKEPPEGFQIPFPVVWVSFFLKIGYVYSVYQWLRFTECEP